MSLIQSENISRRFGTKILFNKINFTIAEGERIALIGINGSGKSELLKILAGLDKADEGIVRRSGNANIVFLEQDPLQTAEGSVADYIFSASDEFTSAVRMYFTSTRQKEKDTSDSGRAVLEMDRLNAWSHEAKAREILSRLGIHDLSDSLNKLSGGQRKRVAIARALFVKPDVFIMDEPTNHLDLDAIGWLEGYLNREVKTILVVTHDRFFLDSVCNGIIELSGGELNRFSGNYENYLEKKSAMIESGESATTKARNLLRKELEWARRMPKARGTKSKKRMEGVEELKKKAEGISPAGELQIQTRMNRGGNSILELRSVTKNFGEKKILDAFSYIFRKRERLGIIGENGVGKTTFLELITGAQQAVSGEITKSQNTKFAYFRQQEPVFRKGEKVIEIITAIADTIENASGGQLTASQFLSDFQFPPPQQQVLAERLSGGEKRRLELARILISQPNFLILDEPTNDLDLATMNALESFLDEFAGCLIIVSHDRFFMDRLCEHLFVFEGDGIVRDFPGNFSQYRESRKLLEEKSPMESQAEAMVKTKEKTKNSKITFGERRELESLSAELDDLEKKKSELENFLATGEENFEMLSKWGTELEKVNSRLDAIAERWMELDEKE